VFTGCRLRLYCSAPRCAIRSPQCATICYNVLQFSTMCYGALRLPQCATICYSVLRIVPQTRCPGRLQTIVINRQQLISTIPVESSWVLLFLYLAWIYSRLDAKVFFISIILGKHNYLGIVDWCAAWRWHLLRADRCRLCGGYHGWGVRDGLRLRGNISEWYTGNSSSLLLEQ